MQTYHKIMLKRDISLKYAISYEKYLCTYKKTILVNKAYFLSHRHIYHKTNNTKSSQVKMHIIELKLIAKQLYHQVISMKKSTFQHNQSKIITHDSLLSPLVQ